MLERQEASGNSPWAHTCWQKTFLGARYTTKRLISTRAILESSSCPVSIGSLFTHQLVGNNPGTTQAKQPASGNPALPTRRSRTWPPGGQHQPQNPLGPTASHQEPVGRGTADEHLGADSVRKPLTLWGGPVLANPAPQSSWPTPE